MVTAAMGPAIVPLGGRETTVRREHVLLTALAMVSATTEPATVLMAGAEPTVRSVSSVPTIVPDMDVARTSPVLVMMDGWARTVL